MNQDWEKVLQFHQHFAVPVKKFPTLLTEDRVQKRAEWMMEEIEEFQEAATIAKQADAMIDIMYFALGTLVEMGVKPDALFDIVHEANMSKLWEDGKPRYREHDGKVIKPSTWKDPDPRIKKEIKRSKPE